MLPHAAWFKARFAEIGPVDLGSIQGHGPNPAEMADGVALALYLFGDEFRGRAECAQSMGSWPLEILHVRLSKARPERVLQTLIVNSHTTAPRNAFFASASSARIPVHSEAMDAFVQPEGGLAVMNTIKQMIETGKPPVPYDTMIEEVAIAEAGRKAHNKAKPVPIERVR